MTLPSAHLHQERHVEIVDSTTEHFVITSEMYSAVIPNQLPHLYVFVHQINDRLDPDDDTLVRVARISDLTTLPQLRDKALLIAGTGQLYLSAIAVTVYTTLTEAITAANVIKDRVSALVTDWMNYYTNFSAPDPLEADILIPTTDVSQKQALIDAYALAKKSWYAQRDVATAAVTAETAAQTALTNLQTLANIINGFIAQATIINNETGLETAAYHTLLLACNAALPGVDAGHLAAFQLAISNATIQDGLGAGYITHATALLSALNAYLGTLNITAAQNALTAATANKLTQNATLASYAAATTAAWNALYAIAPDFDKTTIPYVPGYPDIGPP